MLTRRLMVARAMRRLTVMMCALVLVVTSSAVLHAQVWTNQRAVGGIAIDADGILDNATLDDQGKLSRIRTENAFYLGFGPDIELAFLALAIGIQRREEAP